MFKWKNFIDGACKSKLHQHLLCTSYIAQLCSHAHLQDASQLPSIVWGREENDEKYIFKLFERDQIFPIITSKMESSVHIGGMEFQSVALSLSSYISGRLILMNNMFVYRYWCRESKPVKTKRTISYRIVRMITNNFSKMFSISTFRLSFCVNFNLVYIHFILHLILFHVMDFVQNKTRQNYTVKDSVLCSINSSIYCFS